MEDLFDVWLYIREGPVPLGQTVRRLVIVPNGVIATDQDGHTVQPLLVGVSRSEVEKIEAEFNRQQAVKNPWSRRA